MRVQLAVTDHACPSSTVYDELTLCCEVCCKCADSSQHLPLLLLQLLPTALNDR
jgi:hypothetical protein